MKKFLIILGAVFLSLPGFSGMDWMETSNGKIDCKRINLHMRKANVVLEDGQKKEVNFRDITSFSRNGRVYVKLRMYEENKPTSTVAFMELLGTWNNLKLVKLKLQGIGLGESSNRYYLYNGSQYHLQLDSRTLTNTLNAFGLDYAVLY